MTQAPGRGETRQTSRLVADEAPRTRPRHRIGTFVPPPAQVEQPKESTPDASATEAETGHAEAEDEHPEAEHEEADDGHGPEEHMGGDHAVPEEAAAVENPIEPTQDSVVAGATLYAQNCAVCHGETGEGDGPAADSLEMKPADMHEDHVQELSDGGLFWIISHGRPETPMPPWDHVLTEDERWHVVNFLRTFSEDQ